MNEVPRLPSFRRSLLNASIALLGATALGIAACGGGGGAGGSDGTRGGAPLETSQSAATAGRATVLGAALNAPWGLAFLPDGRMLATEKAGTIALVSADGSTVQARLSNVPAVDATGQGGLLDIAVDSSGWIYFTYSEPGSGGTRGTALARAQLSGTSLTNVAVLWRQSPKRTSDVHFGARIAFRGDGTLFLAVGERGVEDTNGSAAADGVQSPANGLGKVLRLNLDGTIPADNPSFGAGAVPGLWSLGHRNPQGAAMRPGTSELWITEHGPQGGDELNLVQAGGNYGWPLRSYGCPYGAPQGTACRIGGGTHAPNHAEPDAIWVPTSTAPSGLAFYTGSAFPEWSGSLLSGALAGSTLWRITIDGSGNAVSRQEVSAVRNLGARIRDVRQHPSDGSLYLLTNGSGSNANRIVRLAP